MKRVVKEKHKHTRKTEKLSGWNGLNQKSKTEDKASENDSKLAEMMPGFEIDIESFIMG